MGLEHFAVEEVKVAGNRGTCGGANMAIQTLQEVLGIVKGQEPVYINHDLLHNKRLMEQLEQHSNLVHFHNDWNQVPEGAIAFISAHGAKAEFRQIAADKNLLLIDTTCPLVTRVHNLVKKATLAGKHVVYIGVAGHPEAEGAVSEVEPSNISLVQNAHEAHELLLPEDKPVVVYSQTTLLSDEISDTCHTLRIRKPGIQIPSRQDICYATDSRQTAVHQLTPLVDLLLVVGSPHSHNSQMLGQIGENSGIPAYSVDYPGDIQSSWFTENIRTVGLTSGASVLEEFFGEVLQWFQDQNPNLKVSNEHPVIEEVERTFTPSREARTVMELLRKRYPI